MDHLPSFGPDSAERVLQVGDVLCVEGGGHPGVFQIVSGSFDVERATEVGPIVVDSLGQGDLVGELVNSLGHSRGATIRATETSLVRAFTKSQFVDWLDRHPDAPDLIAAQARLRSNRGRASAVLTNVFGLGNPQVVEAIVDEITWVMLAPGDVLFEQGDDADAAYLVIAGRLHVYARDDRGRPTLSLEIGRGEIVGEMGILKDSPRSAAVRAIRATTLAVISRESFEAATSSHPRLMAKVFLTIIDRLSHRHVSDDRARVVSFASTASGHAHLLDPLVDAVEQFGSALHLSSENLSSFVSDVNGPGGANRVAEFLHESDITHDYVLLECDRDLSDWSVSAARQSDRFVLFSSATPDRDEQTRMLAFFDLLSESQRSTAWLVRLHPVDASAPQGTVRFIDDFGVGEVHNVRSRDASHLERIGRLATGNGRGVVLSGGGAKGFAHIGALRALREAGIAYDRIGGTSIGAVIGAFAAKDLTSAEILAVTKVELHKKVLDYTLPFVSLVKAAKMAVGLERQFGNWDIADLWIPFYCVTTNITTSELCVHRRGGLARAVRASAAIPVALPPVPIGGDLHVDGGVLDNLPVMPMHLDNSIGTIIAIDVSPTSGPSAAEDFGLSVSGFEVLKRKIMRRRSAPLPDIGTTLISSMLIGSSKAKIEWTDDGTVDLYVDLDLTGVGLLKFENHSEVAQRGYDGARSAIADWLGGITSSKT